MNEYYIGYGNRAAVSIRASWVNMEGTLLFLDCDINMRFCFIKGPYLLRKLGYM
jgi:hypothetical protein